MRVSARNNVRVLRLLETVGAVFHFLGYVKFILMACNSSGSVEFEHLPSDPTDPSETLRPWVTVHVMDDMELGKGMTQCAWLHIFFCI